MRHLGRAVVIVTAIVAAIGTTVIRAQQPPALRLYVFDGGVLESDPARYHLTPAEVKTTQLSVAAFLVVHPRGTLMWDSGAIADDSWTPTGAPVERKLVLSNGQPRTVTLRASLRSQLASAGYTPDRITYFALSHYHWDHVANANQFASATWLVRKVERDGMFPQPALEPPQPSTFGALQAAKTTVIDRDDFDVFDDGTIVIKKAAGHTPGHQVLYVRLPHTGGVVLTGDLYHYAEERSLNRLPTTEFDENATRASRAAIEAFVGHSGASLWIQHDLTGFRALKKAPEYYD
jgi:glyoxylase-like metal-dependent hydrolase (beta-lactamase superfamily II)